MHSVHDDKVGLSPPLLAEVNLVIVGAAPCLAGRGTAPITLTFST